MSFKLIREVALFLFVPTLYLYTFRVCHSVSLGQRAGDFTSHRVQESPPSTSWREIKRHDDAHQAEWRWAEHVTRGARADTSNRSPPHQVPVKSSDLPGNTLPQSKAREVDETGSDFAGSSLSWAAGNASLVPRSSAPASGGYQADFTGVQGKLLGPPASSQHLSEWLAMRPEVQCDDGAMTFTASGRGFAHLLVDREGASPISLFHLPPHCGYSVRTSWTDLEMMASYDSCYIIKKNDSFVLPMLWWGSPLKLSCPVKLSPDPSFLVSAPSVFCSSSTMAVQIYGHKEDVQLLGVMVNGGWGPFVSDGCAYHGSSQPKKLTFFIPYSAACINSGDDLHLHLTFDDQEYVLSCPSDPRLLSIPTTPPPPPIDPQFRSTSDPGRSLTTPTSHLPTQKQTAQLPQYPFLPQMPQVFPPGSQPARPSQPPPGSPPGLQPSQQQFIYPMVSGEWPYFSVVPPKYPYQSPVVDHSFKLPLKSPPYLSSLYYPHMPFKYPSVTTAPTSVTTKATFPLAAPPASPSQRPAGNPYYPQYYFKVPNNPAPSAAPGTKAPPVLAPLQPPPKQPVGPQYQIGPFYPPGYYSAYFPYGPVSYSQFGPKVQSPSLPSTTTKITDPSSPDRSAYPPGQFYPYLPMPPPLPPIKGNLQATCPFHTLCSHHFSYHFLYHPYYPIPPYSDTQLAPTTKQPLPTTTPTTTAATTPPTPASGTTQMPYVQCLMGWVTILLPFAHPDSIQVKDQMNTWLFLSSVSPLCGYMMQMAEGSGVILHSPLPACHSESRTPTTISLTLRFWDLAAGRYKIVEPQCSYDSLSKSPAPLQQPVTPRPSITTNENIGPIVLPRNKVVCSSHQMTVELPSGSISGIVVKDIKGNEMNLHDAPKHCGYSAKEGKGGKIHLSLQLHSHCHMSVQDKMYIITVIYMTVNGKREAQFSCPVVSSGAGKECNLPSEQRLPCGSGPVSQTRCLSMGCCFSKHPPACYYPMDECTVDRHFVFSVPASLTDPPLSPSMLVTDGNSTCKPERVTSDFAVFKIPLDDCGTRRVMVGQAVIYMVEIINKVQAISLNYGTITRDSPVRLLVECRFLPDTVLSVGYMVKTPTLGPEVHTQGTFGVQLRIAKDAQYSSYYPQYHQPLQMLLGKPLYLEVRLLNTPDPSLVLLVHFCVAYPRSATAVWVLLYNGCPNPLDPALQQAVLSDPQPSSPRGQTRRFTVETFQFLPDGEFVDLDEEIYFMCSTEICSPRDGPCVEGCFGQ
ncbi:uncharacterized protein LOC114862177 [Betta splendens]|uniref:Uncharacterized protein LOC114862177 n=1 Tax=Betta splendens TaxID=158456 RepID=A0A6P7NKQ5_BETSP|nr:uncharacterized protein LOC114862177 [Betta splendens]